MSKITKQQNGVLSVPDVPTIPFITGDGVGAEITPAMQAIVDAAVDMSYGGARRIVDKDIELRKLLRGLVDVRPLLGRDAARAKI